jgi:hypothetical protein
MWRGGVGAAYLVPTLSSAGASLASPCFRFHIPLVEPDVRISRFRLSEKTHAIAIATACDAIYDFGKQLGSCQAYRQSPFLSSLLASAFNWSGKVVARKRASNDADVSTTSPIIPYGGFSPVRLEGWPFR